MNRATRTVARREIRSFIDQPTAYVLAVAFLGLTLYLAFRNLYAVGVASMRPVFDLLPMLLAVFVPAITMRSLAEERRGRTLDWLMSQPLGEVELVLGKFLGNWAFVLLALAGTAPTAIGLLLVSEADPGIIAAQYVGAALLAAQFVAVGLWASSITRNQITAFIGAAASSFALVLIGLPIVQIGLPPVVSGAFAQLSVVSHFQNVARGVIDLRDVLYFVSATALFLVLAGTSLARGRLSKANPAWNRTRIGTAAVAAIVVTLNLLGSEVRGRLDLTRDGLFTLADGTHEILGELDDLVRITLFASAELPPEIQLQLRDVRDLLSDMRRNGDGNLVIREVDPDRDDEAAETAERFGIRPVEFNVLRDDEFQIRRGWFGLAVTWADEEEVIPVLDRTDDLEFRLASGIARMTAETRPRVRFFTEAGARSASAIPGLQRSLGERYELGVVDPDGERDGLDPGATDVLVVAGPRQALDSARVAAVEAYVDGGGAALFLLDPVDVDPATGTPRPIRTGLEALIEKRGIRPTGQMVADLASSERVSMGRQGMFDVVANYPLWPVVRPAEDHILVRGLSTLTLGWGGALELDSDIDGLVPLWATTEAGALRPATAPIDPDQDWNLPADALGPRIVAAASVPPRVEGDDEVTTAGFGSMGGAPGEVTAAGGRLVVVHDASFAEPQFVQANPQNVLFLANTIDWLAQDEALIRIRSKDRTPPALTFTSDAMRAGLKWGNLVGVPLLFVLFGLIRVTGRARRARERWQEVIA